MKYFKLSITISLLLSMVAMMHGQSDSYHEKMAKMQEAKKEFINKEIDFSKEESTKFWVIYDEYQSRRHELMIEKKKAYDEKKSNSGASADEEVEQYISQKEKEMTLHINYLKQLRGSLGAQRVLDVERVERRFDKEVMRKYRDRKGRDKSNNKSKG